MIFWNPFSWWLRWLKAEKPVEQHDEDERPDPSEPADDIVAGELEPLEPEQPSAAPTPWKLRSVGAWLGSASLVSNAAISRDIKFARELGLGRLDLVINDFSGKRQPTSFGTYNRKMIEEFCRRAVDEGFAVHLMTWWMPHEKFIREGASELVDLVGATRAMSVMIDAEEPWTLAARPMNYEEAGALTAEVLTVPFGVTGIGYASGPKLGPLVRRAVYMVPQCYSTAGNTLNPKTAAVSLSNLWRKRFGDRELVVGLAGYRQKGRPGYTQEGFMSAAFETATRARPTDIVYWSMRQIRASRTTANVIRGLAQQASHRAE